MEKIFLVFIYIYDLIKDMFETWFDKDMSFKEKLFDSFIQIMIFMIFFIAILKLWNIIK